MKDTPRTASQSERLHSSSLELKPLARHEMHFLLWVSQAIAWRNAGLVLIMPVLAIYASTLAGANKILIGLSFGVYGLTQSLLQLPFGYVSDKLGRRRLIIFGLLLFALGNLLAARAETILALIGGRAVMGCGAITAVCLAWVADVIPLEKRYRSFGVIGAVSSSAVCLGYIAGPILYIFVDVPTIFLASALVSMLSAVGIFVFMPADTRATRRTQQSSPNDLWKDCRDPELMRFSALAFLMNYFLTSLFLALPLQLTAYYGVNDLWKLILPPVLAGVVLIVPASRLSEQGRTRVLLYLGFFVNLIASMVLTAGSGRVTLVISLFLFVIAYILLGVTVPAALTKYAPPSRYGTNMGIYNTFLFFGAFCGACLSALLLGRGPWLLGISLVGLSFSGLWVVSKLRSLPR